MGLSTNQTQSDDQALLESSSGTVDDQLPKTPPPIRGRQQQQQQSEPLNCPRCISTNTKFCYYNNYNKSQPRHFCKSCKRHWTKGGTLRNVPVGGGRKNKRLKLSSTRSSTTSSSNNNGSNAPVVADQNHQDSHILFQSLMNRDPINGFGSKNLMKGTTNYSSSGPMLLQPPQNDQSLQLSFSTNLDPFGSVAVTSRVRGPEARLISDNSDLGRGVTIPSPIPSFSQSLNGFDFSGKLDTSTTGSIFSQVWQQGPSASNVVGAEMTNYWNWNDIDTLVSADLNIPWAWDDAEIKP